VRTVGDGLEPNKALELLQQRHLPDSWGWE
jgi:hypothetical protein